MGLSRKREKELKRLRTTAADLWDEQREVLDHASTVVREASRQLGNASREEFAPRVRDAVNQHILPAVSTTLQATRSVADDARNRVVHDVFPVVSSALGTALAALDNSRDARVRDAFRHLHDVTGRAGHKAGKVVAGASSRAVRAYSRYGGRNDLAKPKPTLGFGGYLLITIGVATVAGIAYAAWQTLRADDELWVLDEGDDGDNPAL
ncbi:MAG: hypothetical protein H7248_06985 [Microbacteriaceae bacterium]|nr:hypothetical protein [Microbacteriaceae bacterium]